MERLSEINEFKRIRKFVSEMVGINKKNGQMVLNFECPHKVVQGSVGLIKCMICGEINPKYIRKC